jgi:hypothetical protein
MLASSEHSAVNHFAEIQIQEKNNLIKPYSIHIHWIDTGIVQQQYFYALKVDHLEK